MLDRPDVATQVPATPRPARPQARAAADSNDAAAIIGALRRRKWLLLASILLCPLLTLMAITQISPRYTATGTLLYDPSEYRLRELQSILQIDPITDAVMATQAEVLRGMPVIRQITRELNLYVNPEFNRSLRPPSLLRRAIAVLAKPPVKPGPEMPGPRLDQVGDETLDAVQAALTVVPVKSSHVLEVSFTARDAVVAAAAVNDAMDAYVKSQLGLKYGAVERAHDLLVQREAELRAKVRQKEAEIARYRAENGLVEGMHGRLDSEQISLLTENLARARSALAEAEGKLDAARGRAGAEAQAAIAPSVVQLRAQHELLSAQVQSLLGRLGPSHPDVRAARAQLADTDRAITAESSRVVSAIEADMRADREQVDLLQHNLSDAQAQIARDAQAQVPLNAMLRDEEALRGQWQAVLERLQQTAQQPAIEAPDAHEISLALVPGHPSFPPTLPWMAAAATIGVVFGLLLVYVRELTDSTFHNGDDVRTALGLPCFALIPKLSRRTLKGLGIEDYAAHKPHSVLAEQVRALRVSLSLSPDRPRVVAVTAARQGECKTTVTQALGRVTAMNGERVIVLDCDLRHASMSLELADHLRGRATRAEVISADHATGMDRIHAGKAETNTSGLLLSAPMAQLLDSLRHDYDLVLLDTPPAEAITDARILASLADATLFCVRWCATPRHVALHARELLEEAHANVVGAVLTLVDVSTHLRSGYADAEVYHPRYGGYFRG